MVQRRSFKSVYYLSAWDYNIGDIHSSCGIVFIRDLTQSIQCFFYHFNDYGRVSGQPKDLDLAASTLSKKNRLIIMHSFMVSQISLLLRLTEDSDSPLLRIIFDEGTFAHLNNYMVLDGAETFILCIPSLLVSCTTVPKAQSISDKLAFEIFNFETSLCLQKKRYSGSWKESKQDQIHFLEELGVLDILSTRLSGCGEYDLELKVPINFLPNFLDMWFEEKSTRPKQTPDGSHIITETFSGLLSSHMNVYEAKSVFVYDSSLKWLEFKLVKCSSVSKHKTKIAKEPPRFVTPLPDEDAKDFYVLNMGSSIEMTLSPEFLPLLASVVKDLSVVLLIFK